MAEIFVPTKDINIEVAGTAEGNFGRPMLRSVVAFKTDGGAVSALVADDDGRFQWVGPDNYTVRQIENESYPIHTPAAAAVRRGT